jgi:hypothetical protein
MISSQLPGVVYLMKDSAKQIYKIGFTSDLDRRRSQLNRNNGLSLALVNHFRGTMQAERKIHKSLNHYRVVGEWYRLDPMVETVFSEVRKRADFILDIVDNPPPSVIYL